MPNINAKHLSVVLTDLDFFCDSFELWWNVNILPSDTPKIVWYKYLDAAKTVPVLRDWLLDLLAWFVEENPDSHDGVPEAEALLWHHLKIDPPDSWSDVFESFPCGHDSIVEALYLKHHDWEEGKKNEPI